MGTSQDAFGVGDDAEIRAAKTAFFHSVDAPIVMGRSGTRVERGKGCAVAPGMDKAPHSWSWLYNETPDATEVREAAPAPRAEGQAAESASLAGVGDTLTRFDPNANNRRVTKITKFTNRDVIPDRGFHIWKDDADNVPLTDFFK